VKKKSSKTKPKKIPPINLGELTGESLDNSEATHPIKAFLTKMKTQDNRATALPIFYVIRSKVSDSAPLDACDSEIYIWKDETYDTVEELIEECKESEYTEEEIEQAKDEAELRGVKYRWEEHGMFLTETDAEEHLRRNHYHYSKDAHTYVKHAWRAPELESFFNDLFKYFGV
jgi:hypothetical protein